MTLVIQNVCVWFFFYVFSDWYFIYLFVTKCHITSESQAWNQRTLINVIYRNCRNNNKKRQRINSSWSAALVWNDQRRSLKEMTDYPTKHFKTLRPKNPRFHVSESYKIWGFWVFLMFGRVYASMCSNLIWHLHTYDYYPSHSLIFFYAATI